MNSKRWFIWGCFAVALPMVGGCVFFGGGGNDVPSCSQAVNSFYDEDCTFLLNGEEVSASEMIAECRQGLDDAPACGCRSEMNDLLVCVDDVREQQCNRCDGELDDMSACFEECFA